MPTAAAFVVCCWLAAATAAPAAAPTSSAAPAGAAFFESFEPGWEQRWHYAAAKKYKGRFQAVQPTGFQDPAITMPEANQHYGLATVLPQPLVPAQQGLVVQYEAKFAAGHKCGGGYLKLLSQPPDGQALRPEQLRAKTPFSIMFGPDRCGPDARVHVILHLANPALGNATEHHLMSAPAPKDDQLSHVYALVLHANGRYKVLIDGREEASGALASAQFSPPLQPPETIPDPEHVKPEDWVEEEMMDDPAVTKPEGWDDRRVIPEPASAKPEGWLEHELPELPDPAAVKPDDWDEATLGVWLPPPIKNPACIAAPGCGPWKPQHVKNPQYKGPWIPPQVPNPAYKGPWEQRLVPNPAHFKLESPLDLLAPIAGVAFELWTTETGYTFDSVLLGVGDAGLAAAAGYMRHTWRPRNKAEVAAMLAKARADARPPGLRHWAANLLQDVIEAPLLTPLRPHLGQLLPLLQHQPEVAWVGLLLPAGMFGLLLVDRLTRKKASAADVADEDDEAEQELVFDEDEVKRLSKQTSELQKQRQSGGGRAGAVVPGATRQQPPGAGEDGAAPEEEQQQQQASEGVEQASESSDSPPPAAQPRRRTAASRRA